MYFVNSGSEANDLALLMARMYTGKFDILSFRLVTKELLKSEFFVSFILFLYSKQYPILLHDSKHY